VNSRKFGCARASLGSLSEATSVFEADRLKEIISELSGQLEPLAQDNRLVDIQQTITLVDGSLIAALPKIMEASWRKANDGNGMIKWRLHTHFEILKGVPTRIDVTRNGGGELDERAVLESVIEPDRLYVTNRGYAKFMLFNKIVNAGSSYDADCVTIASGRSSRKSIATTTRALMKSSAMRWSSSRRAPALITKCASSAYASIHTRRVASTEADRAVSIVTESCESRRTCSKFRRT